MNCRLCGFEMDDEMAVCPSCGRPVAKGERVVKVKSAAPEVAADKPLMAIEVDAAVADARVNTSLLCGISCLITCGFGIIPQINFGLTGWISYLPVLIPIGLGIASMTFARLGTSSRKRRLATLGVVLSVIGCTLAILLVMMASFADLQYKSLPPAH